MAKNLTTDEKAQLTAQIKKIEAQTDGEIVTVITQACEQYYFVFSLWAALLALLTPFFCSFIDYHFDLLQLLYIQTVIFCLLWLVFQWTPIKYWLVPRRLMLQRAKRMAHELFFMEKLHHKSQRNAIMIFVAKHERYVEILADKDISQHVDASVWKKIVSDFIIDVKDRRVFTGYERAINACGLLLIKHFPMTDKNIDELPNHLIQW